MHVPGKVIARGRAARGREQRVAHIGFCNVSVVSTALVYSYTVTLSNILSAHWRWRRQRRRCVTGGTETFRRWLEGAHGIAATAKMPDGK